MAQDFNALSRAAGSCIEWVMDERGSSAELDAKADALITKLARAEKGAEAAGQVLSANTTIGVFGASQAGKSYLVSRMAAGQDGELTASWDGQRIDFLTHVNPPGHDQEATGFVTRFTHRAAPGIPGFPVCLRVLRECEIAMILVNSFFNDLEQNSIELDLSETALKAHLTQLENYAAAHPVPEGELTFTLEDAVETADYLCAHSAGRLNQLTADSAFWHQARTLLPRLDLNGRARFFAYFWKDCQVFTLLYLTICRELIKLGGRETVYAPLGAFVEEIGGKLMQKKEGTIMCISTLKRLFDEGESITVCLDSEGREQVSLPFAVLAAVSLEMTFPLDSSCSIENFDVLDFPGARERRKDQLQRFLDDEKNMSGGRATPFMREQGSEFIRRGKVAYLFDRYSKRHELDVLLFCIGVRAQQEVSSIVPILNSWIELNAGATPQERAACRYPPLLCALTRFDEIFERQLSLIEGGQPTTTGSEMSNALERISAQGWLANWDGRPYACFYPARRPNISSKIRWLSFEGGKEVGLNPDYQDKIERIKRELLASDLFCAHVVEPEEALDSVLSPDGGVERICRELQLHYQSRPEERERRCCRALYDELDAAVDILSGFARPEGEQAAEEMRQRALSIGRDFLQCLQAARVFGRLRRALCLPLDELKRLYADNFAAGENAPRYARDVMRAFAAHIDKFKDSLEAKLIAKEVRWGWERRRSNLTVDKEAAERCAFFKKSGGDGWKQGAEVEQSVLNLLKRISVEIGILASSERLALQDRLTVILKSVDDKSGRTELMPRQAELAALFLSDFCADLGCAYLAADGRAERYFAPRAQNAEDGFVQLKETEVSRERLLRAAITPDPMGFAVPDIDAKAQLSELTLAADFFSALTFAMVTVNALTVGGAESPFSQESNARLCAALKVLSRKAA